MPTTYEVTEGQDAIPMVVLSNPSSEPVTVTLNTMDGSATENSDFEPGPITVTFEPGETSMPVTIPTMDDDVNEFPESFTVVLSDPVGAQLGEDTATIDIVDNDGKTTFMY